MTIPKNNVIRLRLTDLEKKDWQEAAGGPRKMSEWVRANNNAAAEAWRSANRPGMTDLMVSPEEIDRFLEENPPPAKPQVVDDAIQREVRGGLAGTHGQPDAASEDQAHRGSRSLSDARAGGDDSSSGDRSVAARASAPAAAQCSRWMHHRKGVYCGACKRVITKEN